MASYPPPVPPPPGFDPRMQRRYMRDQMRAQRDTMRAQAAQMRYQMRSHRRGSILGPIVLILIGILFLLIQTNRIENHVFWGWYGRWWPFLLVGAGIVVLAEWAFDQYTMRDPQRTPYRRSIGGGVIFLLVLLGVGGAFAREGFLHSGQNSWILNTFQLNPDTFDELVGEKHESDQALDFACPSGSTLNLVNPRGDVTISGTSDDGRIHLAVHKQVYARTDSDAESKAQNLNALTNTDGSSITINLPSVRGGRADLVIQLPGAVETTVTANRGDIHISAMQAPVTLTANHGDIELSGITGAVQAHVNSASSSLSGHNMGNGVAIQGHADDISLTDVKGPVTIFGDFFGLTRLEHVNGSVHFHTSRTDFQLARLDGAVEISPETDLSADQAVGPVVLTTHNRNITLDRLSGDISVTNRNGTVNLTAAPTLGNITIEDRNGSIRTTMPEHSSFSVQASTTNGSIENDLELAQTSEGEHKNLAGAVGGGGPVVHLTTTNGDVSIHKGSVLPMPPEAPAPPRITLTPPPPPGHAPATPHAPAAPKPAKP